MGGFGAVVKFGIGLIFRDSEVESAGLQPCETGITLMVTGSYTKEVLENTWFMLLVPESVFGVTKGPAVKCQLNVVVPTVPGILDANWIWAEVPLHISCVNGVATTFGMGLTVT
jgi:hypothetical protein